MKSMRDFIEHHLDKLLLTGLFMYMVHVVLLLSFMDKGPEIISWARELTSGFQGALLGLITGISIGRSMAKKDAAKDIDAAPPAEETK